MDLSELIELFLLLLALLPLILVLVVGIIFATSRWRQHPTVSKLVVAASVLQVISLVAVRFLRPWLIGPLLDHDMETWKLVMSVWNFGSGIISVMVWVLMLTAVFIHRNNKPKVEG